MTNSGRGVAGPWSPQHTPPPLTTRVLLVHPSSPELDSCKPSSISTSPLPSPAAVGDGSSGRGLAFRYLHLGDGDLHPFASLQAAFFGRTLACAKWGPLQLAHLATVCRHQWPFLTPHLSTGHRCSLVSCCSAHHPHLALVRSHLGSMWPQPLQRPHPTSGLTPRKPRPRSGDPEVAVLLAGSIDRSTRPQLQRPPTMPRWSYP